MIMSCYEGKVCQRAVFSVLRAPNAISMRSMR
jgi:hypothetical protein